MIVAFLYIAILLLSIFISIYALELFMISYALELFVTGIVVSFYYSYPFSQCFNFIGTKLRKLCIGITLLLMTS